jgi:glycosyltransferase involved in cell wall biosynthesis
MKLLPRPDLIHVHILTRAGIPALWSKITRGTPYIITEHWSRYLPVNLSRGSYTGFLRKAATQMVVKNAGAVTTVTSNLAEAMQKLGLTSRYHVTPNVVDISQFTPETSGMQGIKKLIHVSCFDEAAKNIKGIIDATATLASRRRDFILEIIGSGKDFNEVHDHAVKTGLEGTVIQFRGLLEGEPLISAMRDSDALVMFSNYENLPCTIVESLAVGVPVISTDVGGIKEHLKPEFGTLIKTGDTPALVSAMNDILDGKITFDHRSMRRYAESHFSFSEIGNQFNRIYFEAGMKPD